MMTLSVNDRISYKGEKATVKQIWKKKVKVILSDLREMTVGIDDVKPWTETVEGQIPLIDLSRYEARRGFTDWELESQDAIETLTPNSDQTENVIENLTPDSNQTENVIKTEDAIEIDIQSLSTDQLINLHESVTRELLARDLLPNSHPNNGYEEIKVIKGRKYRYWR